MNPVLEIWKEHPVLYAVVGVMCAWILAATITVMVNVAVGA